MCAPSQRTSPRPHLTPPRRHFLPFPNLLSSSPPTGHFDAFRGQACTSPPAVSPLVATQTLAVEPTLWAVLPAHMLSRSRCLIGLFAGSLTFAGNIRPQSSVRPLSSPPLTLDTSSPSFISSTSKASLCQIASTHHDPFVSNLSAISPNNLSCAPFLGIATKTLSLPQQP